MTAPVPPDPTCYGGSDPPPPPPNQPRGDRGRFAPGASGNPAGRPPRAELLQKAADALLNMIIERALKGDVLCISIAASKLLPNARERIAPFRLGALKDGKAIGRELTRVAQGLAGGELSLKSSDSLVRVLEARLRAHETTDVEARLSEVESLLRDANTE